MLSSRHSYFVYIYIIASRSRMLYTGVTNDLLRRVSEHRHGMADGFTARYRIHRLVYFERFQYVGDAITREKQMKGWLRSRKVELIQAGNPTWEDLYPELVGGRQRVLRSAQDDKDVGDDSGEGLGGTTAGPSLRSG